MDDIGTHRFDTTADTLGVDPALRLATTYRRQVHASVERIWENVFDWEHLPVLHDTYFNAVELQQLDRDGWRVRLSRQPGNAERAQVLELTVDRPHTRYRVRTLEGTGTGTQIWTLLKPLEAHETVIEVRYYLPEHRDEKLGVVGEKYRCSCQQLWDEDEAMMRHREHMQRAQIPAPIYEAARVLGPIDDVRGSLPLQVAFGGHPFRIIALDDELIAHSTVCPHWMGPLDAALPDALGCIRCPWHGYGFDVRSGHSTEGRGLQLAPAPRVAIDPISGMVSLLHAGDGDALPPRLA